MKYNSNITDPMASSSLWARKGCWNRIGFSERHWRKLIVGFETGPTTRSAVAGFDQSGVGSGPTAVSANVAGHYALRVLCFRACSDQPHRRVKARPGGEAGFRTTCDPRAELVLSDSFADDSHANSVPGQRSPVQPIAGARHGGVNSVSHQFRDFDCSAHRG